MDLIALKEKLWMKLVGFGIKVNMLCNFNF